MTGDVTEKFYGFYRGIVIQNNDPERRGRVKIFIPTLITQVIQSLYSGQVGEDYTKEFYSKFAGGSNIKSGLNEFREYCKKITRWAEQASPLVGTGSSGVFNIELNLATVSDSNTTNAYTLSGTLTDTSVTNDGAGISPAAIYERYPLQGNFNSFNENGINNVDIGNNSYAPTSYTNTTKGMFSIPRVGAQVLVFFENGHIEHPMYFAYMYDKYDWHGMFGVSDSSPGFDYPDKTENFENGDPAILRGKTVFNSKAGSLEFTDTDKFEKVKINHYSGSFIEFNNQKNIEIAVKDKATVIGNDHHVTVKGTDNLAVDRDQDTIVNGNKYKKVGNIHSEEAFVNWREGVRQVAETKALFTLDRLNTGSGEFAENPTIQQVEAANSNALILNDNAYATITSVTNATPVEQIVGATITNQIKNIQVPENADSRSPSTKNGKWKTNITKEQLPQIIENTAQAVLEFEKQFGEGGSEITHIVKDCIIRVGQINNDFPTVRVDPIGDISPNAVLIDEKSAYLNYKEHPYSELVGNDNQFPCGNYTLSVGNKYSLLVGSGGITFGSSGHTKISGNRTTITAENDLDLTSGGNINIRGNGKVSITGDIVSLDHPEQVVINSSLGVKNNAIVNGSAYVEGETYLQHVTAPCEMQETEETLVYGEPIAGLIIGYVTIDSVEYPVLGAATPDSIKVYAHSHAFRNLPLTLCDKNGTVRKQATTLNNHEKGVPSPIDHTKKELVT